MLPLLVGLVGGQVALLCGRPLLGGAMLGLTLLIKPIAWPWLIVLAWRRDFRALAATAVSRCWAVWPPSSPSALSRPATISSTFCRR